MSKQKTQSRHYSPEKPKNCFALRNYLLRKASIRTSFLIGTHDPLTGMESETTFYKFGSSLNVRLISREDGDLIVSVINENEELRRSMSNRLDKIVLGLEPAEK